MYGSSALKSTVNYLTEQVIVIMGLPVNFRDPPVGLLLLVLRHTMLVSGQDGVSLELHGVILHNNSLVDLDDILDEVGTGILTSFNTILELSLKCQTDLVDCCNSPRTPRGEWRYPNGMMITFAGTGGSGATFRRNRGASGNNVLGVVRLWRRGNPPERGRFKCEIPSAATGPSVNQILYAHILNIGAVTITPSGDSNTGTAGTSFSLECSATVETQSDTPTPNFEWFHGTKNGSIPSGTVPMATVKGIDNMYTSMLQFTPLQESHAGMYTCRLGRNPRLANNAIITVNRPSIVVTVTHDRNPELGSMYVLICGLSGTERLSPTITYQWTRDNGTTQTVGTNSRTLSFSLLSLYDTGRYTCSVTVNSPYLSSNVLASSGNSQTVMFQVPNPTVTITSNPPSPILDGTNVTLTCSVTMGQGVLPSDLSLLMVDAQLSRNGTTLLQTGPVVTGTTFTYTIRLDSFGRNDSGIYVCSATATLLQTSAYLTGMGHGTDNMRIAVIGVPPPLNVQASQSSASTPVEVSWSPPSGGAATITGYRIFYGNGDNVSVTSTAVTSVGLIFNENAVGQRVSIHSEANKVTSELINATITEADLTKSCSTEVGIAVGLGNLLILCLVAVMIIVITLICCWRQEKTSIDLSRNVTQSVCEEPDKFTSSGQVNYDLTQCPAYESTTSKPQPQPTEAQSSHYEM